MDREDIVICLLHLLPFVVLIGFWRFMQPTAFWLCIVYIILCIPLYFVILRLEMYLLLGELYD